MRLPRDVSGRQLAQALRAYGYEVTRQPGSHLRLTTALGGEHHLTIPDHDALRIGTLAAVLAAVAEHAGVSRDDLTGRLFGSQEP